MRSLVLALLAGVCLCEEAWIREEAWLRENAARESVIQLASGVQYEVIMSAPPGRLKPMKEQQCKCHWTVTLTDGTVFDSTREKGIPQVVVPYNVPVAGWAEALQLMSPGDRWKLYIPSKLAYGPTGTTDGIPPDATLIFDLELIELGEAPYTFTGLPVAQDRAFMWVGGLIILLYYYYNGSSGRKMVSASHILVSEEAVCSKLKKELDNLAGSELSLETLQLKFAELAQQHSTCPSSKKGGSLGSFGPGNNAPKFDEVCWSAPIGVVQGPVQTGAGFHLILVTERKEYTVTGRTVVAKTPTPAELAEQVKLAKRSKGQKAK